MKMAHQAHTTIIRNSYIFMDIGRIEVHILSYIGKTSNPVIGLLAQGHLLLCNMSVCNEQNPTFWMCSEAFWGLESTRHLVTFIHSFK